MAQRYEQFLERYPETEAWLSLGVVPKVAKVLVKAGILSLADLAGKSREELLALPGFGRETLAFLAKCRGTGLPSRKADLAGRGISTHVQGALDRAGIRSMEALGKLTREQFLATRGLGPIGLLSCERALGRKLDSPVEDLQDRGLRRVAARQLASAGVRKVEEVAQLTDSALRTMGLHDDDIADCRQLIEEARERRR